MAQTKQQKQMKTLKSLLAQLAQEQQARETHQTECTWLVSPSYTESRLSGEIHSLQCKLGLATVDSESPF